VTTESRPASIPMRGRTPPRPASPALAALAPVFGALLALFIVTMFVVLDYRFEQAPHRLVKILVAGAVMAWILIKPRFGLYVIPVITPFLPWVPPLGIPGVNPLNILLGSVFMTWALYRLLNRETIMRKSRLGWIFGVILAVGALSIVRGAAFPTGYYFDAPAASLELFRGAVTIAVYFIVLAMARGERDRRWLTWAVVIGLLAEALVTIAYGRNGKGARAEGSIGQSNELGAFLALYTVVAAALIPAARAWFARLLLIVATVAGSYGVIMTVSRGSVLALVVGLGFVALKSSRVMTGLLLALLITCPWWTPQYLKDRMMGTQVEVEGTDEAALEGSAQLRIDTWKAVFRLVSEHPLDGVGFSGLAYVLPEAGDELGVEVKDSAHNTFLRFLSEMGIGGLALFVFLLWRCFQLAREGMRAARRAFDKQMSVGLAASTLALAVSCAFGDRFWNILITGSFWFLCALVNDLVLERHAEVS
jgi:O-antigen ligase